MQCTGWCPWTLNRSVAMYASTIDYSSIDIWPARDVRLSIKERPGAHCKTTLCYILFHRMPWLARFYLAISYRPSIEHQWFVVCHRRIIIISECILWYSSIHFMRIASKCCNVKKRIAPVKATVNAWLSCNLDEKRSNQVNARTIGENGAIWCRKQPGYAIVAWI